MKLKPLQKNKTKYTIYLTAIALILLFVYALPRSGVETAEDVELAQAMCLERREVLPEKTFTSDGCSMWPDAKIQSCCVEHDMEYWCGGDESLRKEVDRKFGECAGEQYSYIPGWMVSLGVKVGGIGFLPTPWRWGYGDSYFK